MIALITGGVGFIGLHVAQAMVSEGWTVRALDSLSPQVHLDRAADVRAFPGEVVIADVRDATAVGRAAKGCSVVIHLAAETGVGQSMYETDIYRGVNIDGTKVVVDAARKESAAVLFASSRAVYGEGAYECALCGTSFGKPSCQDCRPRASAEGDPLLPVSTYGETKAAGEMVVAEACLREVPFLALRPQNVLGAGQALHNPYTGVLAAFVARLRAGKAMLVYGDGSQTRDFVHVKDLVDVCLWALRTPERWAETNRLNVGTGRRATIRALAEATAEVAGGGTIEYLPLKRAGDITHACADVGLLESTGAPVPATPLPDAVGDFVRWAVSRPSVAAGEWDHALQELARRSLTTQTSD